MKKVIPVLTFVVLVTVVVFAETDKEPLPSDRLVDHLSHCLTEMTKEQEEAIRIVHPILMNAAKFDFYRRYFWEAVNTTEEMDIEWEKAKSMILGGQVVRVSQTHSLNVELVGTNGQMYRTIEPKIDAVHHLRAEVDPKGVFIGYETE